jgi:hypothetical protein
VSSFIDLFGATGGAYRFRKAEGALSPIGGNFVYVRQLDGAARVVCCGKARWRGALATAIGVRTKTPMLKTSSMYA